MVLDCFSAWVFLIGQTAHALFLIFLAHGVSCLVKQDACIFIVCLSALGFLLGHTLCMASVVLDYFACMTSYLWFDSRFWIIFKITEQLMVKATCCEYHFKALKVRFTLESESASIKLLKIRCHISYANLISPLLEISLGTAEKNLYILLNRGHCMNWRNMVCMTHNKHQALWDHLVWPYRVKIYLNLT